MAQESHSGTASSGQRSWDALRSAIGTETVEEAAARASAPATQRTPESLLGVSAQMYTEAPDFADNPDIPSDRASGAHDTNQQEGESVGQRVRTYTSVSTGFVPLIREAKGSPKHPTLSTLVQKFDEKKNEEAATADKTAEPDTSASEPSQDADNKPQKSTLVTVERGTKISTGSLSSRPKYRTQTNRTVETSNAWEEDAAQEAAAERPRLLKLRAALIAAAVPLLSLMIAIRAVASAPFLWLEYRRPGFPEDSYGFDLAERMRLGSYGLDYVTNLAPEDYLAKATTGPANTPAFLQSEIQHMHDVKRVLLFATIAVAVFCVLALIGSISLKERAPGTIRRSLYTGAWATVIMLVVLGIIGATSWEWLFTAFHTTFFPQGNWQFRMSDTLIRLYPPQFWIDAALAIVVITLLIIGVLLAFTWPTRYRLVKENRYYKERYQIRQKIKAMRAERDGDIEA